MSSRLHMLAIAAITGPLIFCADAQALPDLYNAVSTASDNAVFSVYRDHNDPHKYWIPFSAISIKKDVDGRSMFSVIHWGITDPDVDGTGASVSFTATPEVPIKTHKSMVEGILAMDPQATFSLLPVVDGYYELLLDNRFVYGNTSGQERQLDRSQATTNKVQLLSEGDDESSGAVAKDEGTSFLKPAQGALESLHAGAGAGPQAFIIELNRLGGRVLSSTKGAGGGVLVLRYKYKVMGVGPRLHARITVNWKRVVQTFQADAGGSFYGGAVTSNHRLAFQRLVEAGAVKLQVLDGGATEQAALDAYIKELYELITKAYVNGTGLFQPQLKSVGAPEAPKGSNNQSFGWRVNVSTFAEQLSEEKESIFEIDKKDVIPQWFSLGFSIGKSCELGSAEFINITNEKKRCISSQSVSDLVDRVSSCLSVAQDGIQKLKDDGVPPDEINAAEKTFFEMCRR